MKKKMHLIFKTSKIYFNFRFQLSFVLSHIKNIFLFPFHFLTFFLFFFSFSYLSGHTTCSFWCLSWLPCSQRVFCLPSSSPFSSYGTEKESFLLVLGLRTKLKIDASEKKKKFMSSDGSWKVVAVVKRKTRQENFLFNYFPTLCFYFCDFAVN